MSKEIILEIGTGSKPFPVEKRRMITADQHYIGIDNLSLVNSSWKEATRGLRKVSSSHEGRLDFVIADGCFLPFPDNSVSEVVLCNLIGYPGVKGDLLHITREARRILRDSGLLTVVETVTPNAIPFGQAKGFLRIIGFDYIDDGLSPFDKQRLLVYDSSGAVPGSYMAKFRNVKSGLSLTRLNAVVGRLILK